MGSVGEMGTEHGQRLLLREKSSAQGPAASGVPKAVPLLFFPLGQALAVTGPHFTARSHSHSFSD